MSFGLLRNESLGEELKGTSWEVFFKRLDEQFKPPAAALSNPDEWVARETERNFGALSPLSASSLRGNNSSTVATLPYKKASCYGFCPTDETESLKIVKCKHCGLIVKVVGYGHHMRLRHGYRPSTASSASNSGDDCQDFLLSPPHLPMLVSTSSTLSGPEFCDASPQMSPALLGMPPESSVINVGTAESGSGSRICSPPYYVEQRKDLVLVLSKRSPLKISSEKEGPTTAVVKEEKDMDEHVGGDSALYYHTIKHRKRKSRKKGLPTTPKSSTASDSRATSVRSDAPNSEEQSLMLSLKDYNGDNLPLNFGDYLSNKLIDINQDDLLGMDDSSMSSSEFAATSTAPKRRKSVQRRTNGNSNLNVLPTVNLKKSIKVEPSTVGIEPQNSAGLTLFSQVDDFEAKPVCKVSRKNADNSSKSCHNKQELGKSENSLNSTIITQLLKFPGLSVSTLSYDGKCNPLKASSASLHLQAKQCLSTDVFADTQYRKKMLKELDAKSVMQSRSFNRFLQTSNLNHDRLSWTHTSCSLPLSPSSESNYSSSSVSDESTTHAMESSKNCSENGLRRPTRQNVNRIELHTMNPLMDASCAEIRDYLLCLTTTNNPELESITDQKLNSTQSESLIQLQALGLKNEDALNTNEKVSTSTLNNYSFNSNALNSSSNCNIAELPKRKKILPFFALNLENSATDVSVNLPFVNSSVANRVLNPILRRIVKPKIPNETTPPFENTDFVPKSGTDRSLSATKFVSINAREHLEKHAQPLTSFSSNTLNKCGATSSKTMPNAQSISISDGDLFKNIKKEEIDPLSLNSFNPEQSSSSVVASKVSGISSTSSRGNTTSNYDQQQATVSKYLNPQHTVRQLKTSSPSLSRLDMQTSANAIESFVSNGLNGIRQSQHYLASTGLSSSSQHFQPTKQQHASQKSFGLHHAQQQSQSETPEQRHQRLMLLRAAQVTGGGAMLRGGSGDQSAVVRRVSSNILSSKQNYPQMPQQHMKATNLAKKRLLNEPATSFDSNSKQNVAATSTLSSNQQALVKKFRPIVPRQSGFHSPNLQQFGVYMASGGSSNAFKGVNGNAETVSPNFGYGSGNNINAPLPNYSKMMVIQSKALPNFRPIAQKRSLTAALQTRYNSGLPSDESSQSMFMTCSNASNDDLRLAASASSGTSTVSTNSGFKLDNELGSPFGDTVASYDARLAGGVSGQRSALTVRRFSANGGIISSQQPFLTQQHKPQPLSATNISKQRNSPSSQLFFPRYHQNNESNSVNREKLNDEGTQFQSIEPPPVLEAEGRVAGTNMATLNNVSINNLSLSAGAFFQQQQQQQMFDKKVNFLAANNSQTQFSAGGVSNVSRHHVNIQLLHQQNNYQPIHQQFLQHQPQHYTSSTMAPYNFHHFTTPLQRSVNSASNMSSSSHHYGHIQQHFNQPITTAGVSSGEEGIGYVEQHHPHHHTQQLNPQHQIASLSSSSFSSVQKPAPSSLSLNVLRGACGNPGDGGQ